MSRFRQQGVAYLALMMAIAIIGIVAANTVQTGAAQGQREVEEELLFVGSEYGLALNRYAEATPAGASRAPRTVDELLRDPRYPGLVRHLRRPYPDPTGGHLEWVWVRDRQGFIIGVHSASNLRPLRTTGFAPNLAHLEGRKVASYRDWVFWGPFRAGEAKPG
jgi:type II secretory pathway pseudopilin PulG